MRTAIIAVGSELLGHTRLDTNSLKITQAVERYGFSVIRKSVVGDVLDDIVEEIQVCLRRADVLCLTGGLGPTEDDLTKEAVARAFSLTLVDDAEILASIEERFAKRGLKMPSVNARQARVFPGQKVLRNARGTAPGFHLNVTLEGAQKNIWIFPGVPWELEGMIETDLESWLEQVRSPSVHRRVIKITGMTESAVEENLLPFYQKHTGEHVTILASRGEIQIHLRAVGSADEAFPRLNQMEHEIRGLFRERIFGLDEETLESCVGRLLGSRGETVSTAESCTGGLLSSRITDVSGSSRYFIGGVVAYSREAKLFLVGVDPALIDAHGEVSEEVAVEMAKGVRRRFGTTYGIGITGIAGPSGGTAQKPVGTVHIAAADLRRAEHRHFQFIGSREIIKKVATQSALDMLRLMILRSGEGGALSSKA
jgi:nicotinamide-nucleotide amidase